MIENVLPLVRTIAAAYTVKFGIPSLTYDDLTQVGSLALVDAAHRWKRGRRYRDRGQAEGHFWAYAKPRVIGAMIDEARKESKSRLVRPVKFVPLELEDEPAAADAVTVSSQRSCPASSASITSSSVMTFVTDAGGKDSSGFCS